MQVFRKYSSLDVLKESFHTYIPLLVYQSRVVEEFYFFGIYQSTGAKVKR